MENKEKKFTASGDAEAENLLKRVLFEMKETLSGTGLCVVLGGSYARGEGGVRSDRQKGLLFNDLDFFVFAEKDVPDGEKILSELAAKYHKQLKIDVDFSRIMQIAVLQKDCRRLMMQELKRNYYHVSGRDFLAEYLVEIPAEKLPFEEAFRLLLNRGMGLLFAAEKIAGNDIDGDFILRNIYKAVLGAGDAVLISSHNYCWKIAERCEAVQILDMDEKYKKLYANAVAYKREPHGNIDAETAVLWRNAADFLQYAVLKCAGTHDAAKLDESIYLKCRKNGETSLFNLIKYCLKSRKLVFSLKYTAPAVSVVLDELYDELAKSINSIDSGRLMRHWLKFN